MSRLIQGRINVTKIDKARLFKGEKGVWLDLTIWINDNPDKYGNEVSIEQKTKKHENRIYLGNGKIYVKNEDNVTAADVVQNDTPSANDEPDDLPF